MAEVNSYETDEAFVIEVKLDEKDPRVCDYCNKQLVSYDKEQGKLICAEDCHSTAYGLLCDKCKGNIEAFRSYRKDEEFKL